MLQAKELWKQEDFRKEHRMKAMRPVLTNLFSSIKVHAQQNPSSPFMAFDVPGFVFGYPLYDHNEAIQYVHDVLVEQGFKVWKTPPSVLFISWMKPVAKQSTSSSTFVPPRTGPDYRPFVYDESAFSFLSRQ
jgi:hypothetical protein